MTPATTDPIVRPLVVAECVVRTPTVVDNLRVGGVVVIDPTRPVLLQPGDRLRLIIDRPGRPVAD
ncbi:MAG TPA: hypothetical protein VFG68_12825 [Fimbriiglobus sp.]|nr:hypothetical protein [Fimbriiglobus sp.]